LQGPPYSATILSRALHLSRASSSLKEPATRLTFLVAFEIPSGKVDPADPSIKHAAVREVWEGSGLAVTGFLGELEPMCTPRRRKPPTGRAASEFDVVQRAIRLNYVATVSADDEVKVHAEEHPASVWASQSDLGNMPVIDEMRKVIDEVLEKFGSGHNRIGGTGAD
jgi:8-oxo-dGTP pyrophosphatase MutT (NUDIX family)